VAFVVFLIAVALYIGFLLWCLSPLVRRTKRRWLGWLRVALAFLLLTANGAPILAMPIVGPVALFSQAASEYLITVVLFPWTLPYYIENIRTRASATANVIEIAYPIEIAGVRYAPVVRSVCSTRKILWADKGLVISARNSFVIMGQEFVGQAGSAIIGIDQPVSELCSQVRRDVRPSLKYFSPRVRVWRTAANQVQSYSLAYYMGGTVAVEDIVLQRPEIVRIGTTPAREIPLGAFWPTEWSADVAGGRSPSIEAYRALSLSVLRASCGEFVTVSLNKVERTKRTGPEQIPLAERPAYCHRVFDGLPQLSLPRIAPIG